jgi:hypothetical protein
MLDAVHSNLTGDGSLIQDTGSMMQDETPHTPNRPQCSRSGKLLPQLSCILNPCILHLLLLPLDPCALYTLPTSFSFSRRMR